ncbi:MAG TPA: preprotein translocase subunit SecG [Bryobacteraceae bacterium]|jgi:preprotein translocase subunit SecG
MVYFLTTLHIIVCLFLVIVVLLQSGKAADLAGAFGGMGSQTAFGPRGTATLLSKWTTIAAAIFMVTSLCLALVQTGVTGSAGSVVDKAKPMAPKQGGAATGPSAATGVQVTPTAPASGGSGVDIKMPQVTPQNVQPAPGQQPVPIKKK